MPCALSYLIPRDFVDEVYRSPFHNDADADDDADLAKKVPDANLEPEPEPDNGRVVMTREWMYEAQQIHDETTYVARLQRIRLHSDRVAYYASVQQHDAEVKFTGEDKFNLFVFLVRAGFVWRLKKFQLRFFELIMQTLAENIVGATWATEGERIMRKHGWRSSPKVCAASAPRRFGKTVTLAVVMCAYTVLMPGRIQSVFSTGGRASGGLRDLVKKTLEESGMAGMLLTHGNNQEKVLVRSIYNQGPQYSTMCFYPSDEKVQYHRRCWRLPYSPSPARAPRRTHIGLSPPVAAPHKMQPPAGNVTFASCCILPLPPNSH